MSPVNTWTFLLMLCVNPIVYSRRCIWLQDNHKDLPNKMLNNFHHMIPENGTSESCVTKIKPNITDLYKIYQVECAAMTIRELFYKTVHFYTKHQEKLVSNQSVWEQLHEDLYHQVNLLEDCISRTSENCTAVQNVGGYFNKLEKILEEQDDAACAQRIIHVYLNHNLLQAARLFKLMRNKYFHKTAQ